MAGRWPSARTINGGARTRWIVGESGIYIPSDASRNSGRRLLKAASEIREMGSMTHAFTWLRRQHRPNECEIELCVGEPLSCRTP
jgi:hypothetical protein